MEDPWGSLGGPWVLLGGSLEVPWRVLGGSLDGSLGDQTGTQGWTGTGPAPGTQKVLKVSNRRQKKVGAKSFWHGAAPEGPPAGLSKISY